MRTFAAACCLSLALVFAGGARAQDAGREVVIPQEMVRFDYAQVLEVQPVSQTLRHTLNGRVCDVEQPGHGHARVVGAVRERLGNGGTTSEEKAAGLTNCRMAPVVREFRRPIAYDVDYVYKGSKYRTRMAQDPGNRLRLRVAITPQPAP